MDTKEFLDWLYGLRSHGVKLGLGNITELLDSIGNPQRSFKTVHVAGTDGKGSICACISSILRESVPCVGLYTSPHILEFNERIKVNGVDITDSELADMASEVIPAVSRMSDGGMVCTFFEVTTAMAFLFFKRKCVDYAVVEVGMGGRFDATNVIVPEVSIIANISLDHTEFLGNTVDQIAFEKAGIIKPGVPCVTLNTGSALEVINKVASDRGAPFRSVRHSDIEISENRGDGVSFTYMGDEYYVAIPGRHQAANASLVIEAASILGCSQSDVEAGLAKARWPCRMEKVEGLPLILDVTHTDAGSRDLASDISEIYGKVILVFGMLGDKSIRNVSSNLSSIAIRAVVARPESERAASGQYVADVLSEFMDGVVVTDTVQHALDIAMDSRGEDETILVTGSFHMAEGALKWLKKTYPRF